MTTNLTGQVSLVTGSGSGIGRGIALELARSGAAVALFGRNRDALDGVAREIAEAGGRAIVVAGDVTIADDVQRAVAEATDSFGPVSFLVNNAGRSQPYGPIGVVDPAGWWQTQAVHVLGPMLFMSAVIPAMREQGWGRIVNVSSKAGQMVVPGSSAYCVSKSTVITLSDQVLAEQRDAGLTVFAIHPGSILTDMVRTALSDPAAPHRPLNPDMEGAADADIARVGGQVAALATGQYDELAGGLLDLEVPLDQSLAASRARAQSTSK